MSILTKEEALKKWRRAKNKTLFLSRYQLPEELIETKNEITDWLMSEYESLHPIWYNVIEYKGLTEDFILRNIDYLRFNMHWSGISRGGILSEEFIERYQDKVDWRAISCNQKLSESFIERFADKVNWIYVSEYQSLSRDFVIKHFEKLEIYCLLRNQKISKEVQEEIRLIHYMTK